MQPQNQQVFCRKCEHPNDPDVCFCARCGNPLAPAPVLTALSDLVRGLVVTAAVFIALFSLPLSSEHGFLGAIYAMLWALGLLWIGLRRR